MKPKRYKFLVGGFILLFFGMILVGVDYKNYGIMDYIILSIAGIGMIIAIIRTIQIKEDGKMEKQKKEEQPMDMPQYTPLAQRTEAFDFRSAIDYSNQRQSRYRQAVAGDIKTVSESMIQTVKAYREAYGNKNVPFEFEAKNEQLANIVALQKYLESVGHQLLAEFKKIDKTRLRLLRDLDYIQLSQEDVNE